MSKIINSLVDSSSCSVFVRDIYQEIQREFGFPFVPNFFKALANSETLLATTWTMVRQNLLYESLLSRLEKEIIMSVVSGARGCHYCKTAHIAFCCSLKVDSSSYRLLVENKFEQIVPYSVRAMVIFATKIATKPSAATSDDLALLSKEGIDEDKALEIIEVASMATYLSLLADTFGVEVDEQFKEIINDFERSNA